MAFDAPIDMKKFCDGKLTPEQEARVREVAARLQIREDDAVWQLLEAMEYQRIFYEKLPKRIEDTSGKLLKNIKETAEAEVAKSKTELTKSVVQEARYLASKIQWSEVLPLLIVGIISMFAYTALSMWAGFQLGAGEIRPIRDVLLIPWTPLVCLGIGLCGVFYLLPSLKKLCDQEEYAGWHCLAAIVIIIGSVVILNLLNIRFTERILG